MSKQDDVAASAEALVGQSMYWAPFHLALYSWATTPDEPHGPLGLDPDHAINCYSLPILLAVRRGYLNKAAVLRILGGLMDGKGTAKAYSFSTAWTATLWQDWKAVGDCWRPRRGDLVFFEAYLGGVLNHVAISTGKISAFGHSEVISFGERLEREQAAKINKTSIELLRQEGHTSIRFLTPSWD